MIRFIVDKDSYQWESQISLRIPADRANPAKQSRFLRDIAASDRVKEIVKQQSAAELLEHYILVRDGYLTNLGILWIGRIEDRARLLHAPIIQFIKYDARGERVSKYVWNDFSLNPAELIEAVWSEVPDWRESTELPDGLFRKQIPHYDEVVIRELLVNALVHRPYTTKGDIFINLHPDHLEIRNPGSLPLGITPSNILQKTIRRNELLARIFHDLRLMEGEGSGYDRIYETQLAQAKAPPVVIDDGESVTVSINRRILNPELVDFLHRIDQDFNLSSRERIALGMIAQHGSLTALEFGRLLQIDEDKRLRSWIGRLIDFGIVRQTGQTRATEYCITPETLRSTNFRGRTTLKSITPHRLEELIRTDLTAYPDSKISTIHQRIGIEISGSKLSKCLGRMRQKGIIVMLGTRRGARYRLAESPHNAPLPNNPIKGP